MQNHSLLVLEEGSCPFIGGPDFACCYLNLTYYR
jgi:hypothetical protein